MASSMVDERRGGGGAQGPGRASAAGTTHCKANAQANWRRRRGGDEEVKYELAATAAEA